MKYDPDKHHRQSIRLKDYDYSQNGAYFVTICTYNKEYLFGNVVDGKMDMSEIGAIVGKCWNEIPDHFQNVLLDHFVVMPNHIHGIITLHGRGIACYAPTVCQFSQMPPNSIPTIILSYKSAVTKQAHELDKMRGIPIWQRNYYEHVIRNDDDLNDIRGYIINNPLKWALDSENIATTVIIGKGKRK